MLVEQGGRGDGMGLELSVPLTVALLLVFSGSVRWHSGNITFVSGTIPADRMKAEIQHRVPLSLQAVAVLENLQGLCIFRPKPTIDFRFNSTADSDLLRPNLVIRRNPELFTFKTMDNTFS